MKLVDVKRDVIQNLNDQKYLKRCILKYINTQKVIDGREAALLKYVFRLARFDEFFEYLIVHAMLSGGRPLDPTVVGRSPRVLALYPLFSDWIVRYFVNGESVRPPVNESQGMAFVSTILDGAEAHLSSIRATAEAKRVASARGMIDRLFQNQGESWVLSSNFVSHIGHFVYAAVLLELQRRGRMTGQAMGILAGPSQNAFMLQVFQPHLLTRLPDGVPYAEMISARKRHLMADGCWATMSELVSEAARIWSGDAPFFAVDQHTRARGDAALSALGVPPDAPIVTLHVREAGYNANIADAMSLRDAQIADYRSAISAVTDTGAWVVRIGDRTMARAEPQDRLIDYPFTDAKADWMDIYLAARCRFHIGSSSGMSFVPLLFGRPALFTNWITMAHIVCAPGVVTLPKLLLDGDGDVVPLKEYCDRHGQIVERSDAALHGLSFRDNSPDDIADAVRLIDRHIDSGTGRLALPEEAIMDTQAVFANASPQARPQIPRAFWRRYYAGR